MLHLGRLAAVRTASSAARPQYALAPVVATRLGDQRHMATLKELSARLKSVKSIQKITKSMKMVSAAKFAKAERELKGARVFGAGALGLQKAAGIKGKENPSHTLIIAVSSDRGLCGAVHSSLGRHIKRMYADRPADLKYSLVFVGDKVKQQISRLHPEDVLLSFNECGRMPPTFEEATLVAQHVLKSGCEYDSGIILFNTFKSAIAYENTELPICTPDDMKNAEALQAYEEDDDIKEDYQEFVFASSLYYAMKEQAASEQSARMQAMENASKNAGEMIDGLSLKYNRMRQAVITNELIEILSGAAALD